MKKAVWCFLFVILVFSCRNAGDERRMAQIIAEADSMNRNFVPMTSDSLLLEACRYYDRHGTSNQRMMAHYLLGCVYRDRGEAPHAIDCYMDAVSKADTTASDCDYHVLGCVYSQMADTYHKQFLFSYENEARRQAQYYAILAGDTIYAIWGNILMAGAYIQQSKTDSAEYLLQEAIRQFQQRHNIQEALQASEVLMYIYAEQPEQSHNLKRLIDEHETYSLAYDERHELIPQKRLLYYYKGRYYEHTRLLDSAEYYYRKIQHSHMSYSEEVAQNKGLLSIYKKRHQADSIAKYAELYCIANDSSVATTDKELTARMTASYRYNRFQRIAFVKEREAANARMSLTIIIITTTAICIVIVLLWYRSKERQQQKVESIKAEYFNTLDNYRRNLHTLQLLEDTHKIVITEIRKELITVQHENAIYRNKESEINLNLAKQNEKYEAEKAELAEENKQLKQKIEYFQQLKEIGNNLEMSKRFADEDIIKRIYNLKETPQISISPKEKEVLLHTSSQYFPAFLQDVRQSADIPQLGIYVSILTALNLRSSEIANILNISIQQVANMKQKVNSVLFNDPSARTLYKNLSCKYQIYTS